MRAFNGSAVTQLVRNIVDAYDKVRHGAVLSSSCAMVGPPGPMKPASSRPHGATVSGQSLFMIDHLRWRADERAF
jgi:hypothetical protein